MGAVGTLQGLPVVVDASIPTNLGTNEDVILVIRASDTMLFGSVPRMPVLHDVNRDRVRAWTGGKVGKGRIPRPQTDLRPPTVIPEEEWPSVSRADAGPG